MSQWNHRHDKQLTIFLDREFIASMKGGTYVGLYVNPGNQAFRRILSPNYVDMTGLIRLVNERVGGVESLICVSRPRRFGKSYAAKMLTAYYDCSCDSHALFDRKIIARSKTYHEYLNRFNVICLDITGFISAVKKRNGNLRDVPILIEYALWKDLVEMGFKPNEGDTLNDFLVRCVDYSDGRQFVFIIDEWDAMIREAKNDEAAQTAYLNLLRSWFKNTNFTPKVVAAAYMTGILPIKKDGSQSAISDFHEYSMLYPGKFVKYTGFSEAQVRRLCKKSKMDFESLKTWYDGYELAGEHAVYNPYSVVSACREKTCRSYWNTTSAAEAMTDYINMDFDGLQETVARLIGGAEVEVNTSQFQNDFERFKSKDDVLTLLIHLGYLTYDNTHGMVRVPNEEVREEFRNFLSNDRIGEHWRKLIGRSRKLLEDTIRGDNDAVAAVLEAIRDENYAPQFYNDEQALRAVIKYAYISAFGQYLKIEEMPSGKGIADIVFIPKTMSRLPTMIVELKWNKTAGGAIDQIKDNAYDANLRAYEGNLLLVGINYDARTHRHTCSIERI